MKWKPADNPYHAYARAKGRDRYNATRKRRAESRRNMLFLLLMSDPEIKSQRDLAKKLNVSPATITRDLQKLGIRPAEDFRQERQELELEERVVTLTDELYHRLQSKLEELKIKGDVKDLSLAVLKAAVGL